MSNPAIHFRGPYAYAWAALVVLLLGWAMWSPVFLPMTRVLLGFRVWYTLFMPLELFGAWRNSIHDQRGEEEQIRTLSQLMQRIGEIKNSSYDRWWKGWSALVTGFATLLAVSAGLAFWPIGPFVGRVSIVGTMFATTVFVWLTFHFLRRYRYG